MNDFPFQVRLCFLRYINLSQQVAYAIQSARNSITMSANEIVLTLRGLAGVANLPGLAQAAGVVVRLYDVVPVRPYFQSSDEQS